ncbi:MAG: hypothetical protein ACJZ57_06860 [Candidatus Poriferisodalaceae bacterium]
MRPSGTEPGDFVEFDYDLVEAERRQHIRDVLSHVRPTLEKETGVELEITNDGNDLVLSAAGEIRFRAALAPDGRVVVTDLKSSNRL